MLKIVFRLAWTWAFFPKNAAKSMSFRMTTSNIFSTFLSSYETNVLSDDNPEIFSIPEKYISCKRKVDDMLAVSRNRKVSRAQKNYVCTNVLKSLQDLISTVLSDSMHYFKLRLLRDWILEVRKWTQTPELENAEVENLLRLFDKSAQKRRSCGGSGFNKRRRSSPLPTSKILRAKIWNS